jgi:hypothetical protein
VIDELSVLKGDVHSERVVLECVKDKLVELLLVGGRGCVKIDECFGC